MPHIEPPFGYGQYKLYKDLQNTWLQGAWRTDFEIRNGNGKHGTKGTRIIGVCYENEKTNEQNACGHRHDESCGEDGAVLYSVGDSELRIEIIVVI